MCLEMNEEISVTTSLFMILVEPILVIVYFKMFIMLEPRIEQFTTKNRLFVVTQIYVVLVTYEWKVI